MSRYDEVLKDRPVQNYSTRVILERLRFIDISTGLDKHYGNFWRQMHADGVHMETKLVGNCCLCSNDNSTSIHLRKLTFKKRAFRYFFLFKCFSFIQALVTILCTLGFTRGLATIAKYPAFVIMPVFTFWTFGGSSQIKLSFRLTWINTLITLAGEIEGSNGLKGVLEE